MENQKKKKGRCFIIDALWKKIAIFILIILFIIAFSHSYTSLSIDNLAFVVALGIDLTEANTLKVSFQFSDVSAVSETGSTEKSPTIINTVESTSINTAINLMNTYIGKELNLSHCKLIVFSEELAYRGISDEVYSLINNPQVRSSTNIVISKVAAKYYIENSEPSLENLVTKYYEVFPNSSSYTGYTANATIGDFFNNLNCNSCEPYAILGGINNDEPDESTSSSFANPSNMKSNQSTITGKRATENIGLAVFKNDKLVGELNAEETLCFLMLKNDVKRFLVSVKNPSPKSESLIDISIFHDYNADIDVDIINSTPYISINLKFIARVQSMTEDSKLLNTDLLKILSENVSKYIESHLSDYLYKTSKEFHSDIDGFGKMALSKFITSKEYANYDWLNNYKNAFFNVHVDTNIKSGLLLTET